LTREILFLRPSWEDSQVGSPDNFLIQLFLESGLFVLTISPF